MTSVEPAIAILARRYGLEVDYHDGCGVRRRAPDETVMTVLETLGATPSAARERTPLLDAVTVAWEGRCAPIVRLGPETAGRRFECRVTLEDGQTRVWAEEARALPAAEDTCPERRRRRLGRLSVPVLPFGCHQLSVTIDGQTIDGWILSAPRTTWPHGGAERGVFLPLHALHTAASWGVGDLTDLERMATWLSATGIHVVSLLPLLATDYQDTPCDPSPYRPLSRLFWNELYVDPRRLPELETCEPARRLVASPGFQRTLDALRAAELVDYPGALAVKRQVLTLLANAVAATPGARQEHFHEWCRAHPRTDRFARFRAAREHRDRSADAGATRRYHLYAQWVAAQQVREVAGRTSAEPHRLYLDLPVGVRPDAFDVAEFPDAFACNVTIGAPPDELFPGGQQWQLPPPHPRTARLDGYRYLRASLAHHLSVAGCLRIDHVMGLHRLFWMPEGGTADDGVYVHYPADELYAVIALESWRHRTPVVGENLGTVPSYVDDALERHGMGRLHVAQFLIRSDDPSSVPAPPPAMVASLNTHDTATFAGFLRGLDIDDRVDRGLLVPAEAPAARAERRRAREALVRLANAEETTDEALAMLRACLERLVDGDADLVLVALEDLWLEPRPQNVPGTGPERSNWRRRAAHAFETFSVMPEVQATLRRLAAAPTDAGP